MIENMVKYRKLLYKSACMNYTRYAKSFPFQLHCPNTTNYGICSIFLKLSNAVVMDL